MKKSTHPGKKEQTHQPTQSGIGLHGINRTGIDTSPIDSKETIAEAERTPPTSLGNAQAATEERSFFEQSIQTIGTIPPPATVKGVVDTGLQKLASRKPEVFIDKLGERLAFERSGVRLYDALLNKCENRSSANLLLPVIDLRRIRTEEHAHFTLLTGCMQKIGADPTALTPCADLGSVEAMGLFQVLTDPRTSVVQCLHSILIAELADHDGWETLSHLAAVMNQDEMVDQFKEALDRETEHLETIRTLYSQLTEEDAGAMGVAA